MDAINDQLREAIKARDLTLVRSAIVGEANADRSRAIPVMPDICKHAAAELTKLGLQLFESDDGETAIPPREEWTREAWTSMKVELKFPKLL